MLRSQHMAYNASLNASKAVDMISQNIVNYGQDGHKAKRWRFTDFMIGGNLESQGVSWDQGKQEPRIGEWTKMMIRGKGVFTVQDPRSQEVLFSRLGDFHINAQGDMVTPEGFRVQAEPLQGVATSLRGPNPTDPDAFGQGDINFNDPFNNPITNNRQELNPAGQSLGRTEGINLRIDPRNGLYLGQYEEIRVDEDGVLYGKAGNDMVSLYRLRISNFNNPEALQPVRDGLYWRATKESGLPSLASGDSDVISEAIEKSNVWLKQEVHYLTEAQRYYQAATQIHKLSDKLAATAIEMIS